MSLAVRFAAEPVRSLGEASIGASYAGVGTAIANPARQFIVQNLTDVTLMFSFDGVNDHFPLATGVSWVNDISSNQTFNQGWYLAEGVRLYVKDIGGGAPSTGSVYFSVFYGAS